jgi:hypothetical protein
MISTLIKQTPKLLTAAVLSTLFTTVSVTANAQLSNQLAPEQGGMRGGGGNAVVCRDAKTGEIKSAKLYDYFELEVQNNNWVLDLGPGRTHIEKVNYVLEKLSQQDDFLAQKLNENWIEFEANSLRVDDRIKLPLLNDSIAAMVPSNRYCGSGFIASFEQAAIRRDILSRGEKKFVISQTIWNAMNEDSKAGLVLHELIYSLFAPTKEEIAAYRIKGKAHPHENSIFSRQFNNIISSTMFRNTFIHLWYQNLEFLPRIVKLYEGYNHASYRNSVYVDDGSSQFYLSSSQVYPSGLIKKLDDPSKDNLCSVRNLAEQRTIIFKNLKFDNNKKFNVTNCFSNKKPSSIYGILVSPTMINILNNSILTENVEIQYDTELMIKNYNINEQIGFGKGYPEVVGIVVKLLKQTKFEIFGQALDLPKDSYIIISPDDSKFGKIKIEVPMENNSDIVNLPKFKLGDYSIEFNTLSGSLDPANQNIMIKNNNSNSNNVLKVGKNTFKGSFELKDIVSDSKYKIVCSNCAVGESVLVSSPFTNDVVATVEKLKRGEGHRNDSYVYEIDREHVTAVDAGFGYSKFAIKAKVNFKNGMNFDIYQVEEISIKDRKSFGPIIYIEGVDRENIHHDGQNKLNVFKFKNTENEDCRLINRFLVQIELTAKDGLIAPNEYLFRDYLRCGEKLREFNSDVSRRRGGSTSKY